MKPIFFVLVLFVVFKSSAQDAYTKELQQYQYQQNLRFHNRETSPLTASDFKTFKALDFYTINAKYRVTATLKKEANPILFEMPTTTNRKALYIRYGTLTFNIDGQEHTLYVYQNKDFDRDIQYKNYLFLPFRDATSGVDSYGGGRYIDLLTTDEKPDGTMVIDFNKSYNPYCVYNPDFSCPITPKENTLAVAIKAGVKDYKAKKD